MSPASVSSQASSKSRPLLQPLQKTSNPPRKLDPIFLKPKILKCYSLPEESSISIKELTKSDINWYRLSFYENICLNILQAGYHQTYVELFNLVQIQKELREKAGSASSIWNITPLRKRKDQLQFMLSLLIQAENATNQRSFDKVYQINLSLAEYFRASEDDRWLVKYFLSKCNRVASKTLHIVTHARCMREKARAGHQVNQTKHLVRIEQTAVLDALKENAKRRVLESSYHILAFLYETGQYIDALFIARNLYKELKNDSFYRLPPSDPAKESDPEWLANAPLLRIVVCEQLCKCILKLQQPDLQSDTVEDQTVMLLEALDFATESGNESLMGTCKLRICEEYERLEYVEQAFKYAQEYYELAKRLNDPVHRIQSCKAMARIYERLSDIHSAQLYLDEIAKLAETCEDPVMTADVDRLLASFHVTQSRDYAKAHDFAESGFRLALHARTSQLTCNTLRVWCGLAKGTELLEPILIPTVAQAQHDERTMGALLDWRSFNIPLRPIKKEQFLEKTKSTFCQRMQMLRPEPVSTPP